MHPADDEDTPSCPFIDPRLAVCDHFHRGSVRYVMVSRSAAAYN